LKKETQEKRKRLERRNRSTAADKSIYMANCTALLALAQYPGAPGLGLGVAVVWLASAVSAMFGLWGKEGTFYETRVWKKVLLTIAVWLVLPVVLIFLFDR
jgi:hypothetical protein